MALATYKPTVLAREAPKDTSVVSEPRKHEIYDHTETPLWSLDAFLSGSPWEVSYFRQRLGKNDTTKKLDLNSSPAYQSYEKIERLEILVQSALSPSFKDKEQLMEVTGSATLYSFITPNVDDYFIATSNLARTGLFRITNVNRRTFERESVHVIEYSEEKEFVETDPVFQDLTRKVVVTHVFSKQRMVENRNPLLLKHSYDKVANLKFLYKTLVQNYFNSFFQMAGCTLLIPGQIGRHYDPMLAEYVCKIVSVIDAPQIKRMHLLSNNNDESFNRDHLWSLMIKRGKENLPYLTRVMGKIQPTSFTSAFFASSGSFGNADFMIYPKTVDETTESLTGLDAPIVRPPVVDVLGFRQTSTFGGGNLKIEDNVYTELTNAVPIYNPIHSLTSYVFPETFYDGQPSSLIEIITLDYLSRSPMNLDMLLFLVSFYPKMERLEQFYYGPILMTLLKEADRGAYA